MRDIDQFIDEVLFKESDQYKLIYETVLQEMLSKLSVPDIGVAAEYIFAVSLRNKLKNPETNLPQIFIQSGGKLYQQPESEIIRVVKEFLFKYEKAKDKREKDKQAKQAKKAKEEKEKQKEVKEEKDIETEEEKFIYASDEQIQLNAEKEYKNIYNLATSYIDARLDDLSFVAQFKIKDVKRINLIGQGTTEYTSSADIELITVDENKNEKKFKISLKYDNEYLYRLGSLIPSDAQSAEVQNAINAFNTTVSKPTIYQLEGGGYKRLYGIFRLPTPDLSTLASDVNIWKYIQTDFTAKFNSKYTNSNETKKFFTAISNMITRADSEVYMLSDISYSTTSILPSLLDKFVGYFKTLQAFVPPSSRSKQEPTEEPTEEPVEKPIARPPIKFGKGERSTKPFASGPKKPGEFVVYKSEEPDPFARGITKAAFRAARQKNINEQTEIEKKDESDRIAIKIFFEDKKDNIFNLKDIENFDNLSDLQKQSIEKITEKNNLEANKIYSEFLQDLKSLEEQEIPDEIKIFTTGFETARVEFENLVNSVLSALANDPKLLFVKLEKKSLRLGIYNGLYAISDLNKLFSYVEKNDEFVNLKKCFDLFLSNKDTILDIMTSPPQKTNESLFESLILEALNEKELKKITSKISSAKPEGFVSVLPSNKTPNSLAVRFEDEESLDKGISKIKTALKSAGYKLQDERILKFDDKRDTTNVMKNGEVLAKVFYRVDIAEREGLAYEHIIGFVLTGKDTEQLKNRIDLGPDASREEVIEKLKSDKYKHLFKSALEAKPIILNKVGKVISAESVGSTNNKADFILKTAEGKTVGLSAKYATGEKDNEYKMNKVLGFGTEDDSLVYNPKAEPWWVVGRKTFLEKLKSMTGNFKDKNYDPDFETLDAPAWMKSAKEKNPDVYKETMEEVYGKIRNILTKNLMRMSSQDLMAFVREADVGKDEENKNYDMFVKVKDGPSGLTVSEISLESGGSNNFDPKQVVRQDRSDIIIEIPGMQKLTINSVKFKSDMLSSKAGDLKIKTR